GVGAPYGRQEWVCPFCGPGCAPAGRHPRVRRRRRGGPLSQRAARASCPRAARAAHRRRRSAPLRRRVPVAQGGGRAAMKLRGKFTAVFAVALLTTILLATVVLRVTIRRYYEEAAAGVLSNARQAGEAQFHALARTVQDAASALADPHDRDTHDLLVDLQRGTFDEDRQRELAHRAPE